jgi:di/tripeptidase
MRSEGVAELTALEKQVREVIEPVCAGDSVKADIEVVGDRPAGGIPKDHPLVKTVEGVQAKLGMKPSGRAGSTDANVPLNMGIPAVCIGCTTGGNGHRPDEWLDEAPFALGLKQLIMVTAELAG